MSSHDKELVIKVVAMPADTNPDGDMFGGWLLSQMDLAGYLKARKLTRHRLVTVAIENIVFHKPVYVGDCLLCYGTIERVGRTSVTVKVEAQVERKSDHSVDTVTEGRFVLVAIGPDKKPIPLLD